MKKIMILCLILCLVLTVTIFAEDGSSCENGHSYGYDGTCYSCGEDEPDDAGMDDGDDSSSGGPGDDGSNDPDPTHSTCTHAFNYSENDSITHNSKCARCGVTYEQKHSGSCHTKTQENHTMDCDMCQNSVIQQHTFVYQKHDETKHIIKCKLCSYQIGTGEHKFTYTANLSGHIGTCTDCGYKFGREAHQPHMQTKMCMKCNFPTDFNNPGGPGGLD